MQFFVMLIMLVYRKCYWDKWISRSFFSPTAYHGVVASVISPGNFNGVGQVIYDTVAFPNILGELYVIDYELI